MSRLVAGVDGGGTRTRAVLLDEAGREVGRAEVPGSVARLAEPGEAASAVAAAVHAALAAAGAGAPVDVVWAGLAGAGRTAVREAVRLALEADGIGRRIVVGTDVEAAFLDAFGTGPGVLLVAGTGSIAWAQRAGEPPVRVGGWGEHIGDEGSGFWLGREALRRIAWADDGRGTETGLTDALLRELGLDEAAGLVDWAARAGKADLAALVPNVVAVAEAGDPVAVRLLDEAVEALVAHVKAAFDATSPWQEPPPLALWGGLLWDEGPLRKPLLEAVRRLPVEPIERALDPPMGAARAALEELEPIG